MSQEHRAATTDLFAMLNTNLEVHISSFSNWIAQMNRLAGNRCRGAHLVRAGRCQLPMTRNLFAVSESAGRYHSNR
jgi:hypothetical protein